MAAQKVRNTSPIKINEYRVRSGGPANATDSFIELYNAGSESVDLTHWTLTEHPAHEAVFSAVEIPAGTRLAAGGFYLLGLSNSGLAVPARAGEGTLHVRSTEGMSVGDTIHIGDGSGAETRKIATLGSAASDQTTVWQPLPDGPVITINAGATNLPVESVAGFTVGQKIALGHGTTYPAVANTVEKYEVATVTAVGKPGTQAYLAVDAHTGENNIKVTSVSDLSVGDKIRLDIGSVGHGIETATVTHIGTVATKTNLSANAMAGGTRINVRRSEGFAVGDKILVGTPASQESVTVTAMGSRGRSGVPIDIKPALTHPHVTDEWVVSPGAGVDLAAPLKYNHAANLPFSDRGTGITFEPATAFAHSSNEPVQALGTGITLDKPLAGDHAIHEVVRDEAVKTAGYQGTPAPNQWFGGPELMTRFPIFGRTITIEEGSMVLRDASGVVADSLNYGAIADPWAAEGSQAASGSTATGCYAPAPASMLDLWSIVPNPVATNTSGGRFPDGADTDSNCNDFLSQTAASLSRDTASGETNIKVDSVEGFATGQKLSVDSGSNRETALIATVGTAGATSLRNGIDAQTTNLPAAGIAGFKKGEAITIDSGANAETAIVSSTRSFGGGSIIVTAPVARAHAAGVQISGSGITLSGPLSRPHARGTQVSDDLPTPGGPNQYHRTQH